MAQAGVRRGGLQALTAAAAAAWLTAVSMGAPAAAASSAPTPQASAPARSSALPAAVRFVPGSLLLPPPGPRPALRDTCGARALAWLVGQPRSRIPIPADLSHRRVSCAACVVASDVKLDRLDILYDARTNLITRVTCG